MQSSSFMAWGLWGWGRGGGQLRYIGTKILRVRRHCYLRLTTSCDL
jgi:hypothetical protein